MTDPSSLAVAITGGSGIVGTALRRVLAPQFRYVRIIDIAPPADLAANESYTRADLAELDQLVPALDGIDAIIHLGGLAKEAPIADILRVNALGAINLYEAARANGIERVVVGSSYHAVGFYPAESKVPADAPMRPDGYYGLSKCWTELAAGLYFDKAGIRSLIIRIGNAYPVPTTERHLHIWVSPGDLAQLCLIGLTHPDLTVSTVYGVSAGSGAWWDNSEAARLGYVPHDRIADFLEIDPNATSENNEIAEYFQGGVFTTWGHDGTIRQR